MGDKIIQNRDQLVCALHEASELEQGLMCLYLFAALSMKKANDPGITPAQAEQVRRWEANILMISRQEMEHLALVNNLLIAIGAEPYFSRPNFPVKYGYYPIPLPFILERFNDASLLRFIAFEAPERWTQGDLGFDAWPLVAQRNLLKGFEGVAVRKPACLPYHLEFKSVQALYEEIGAAVNNVHKFPALENLFIGNPNQEPYQDFQFNFEFNIFTFQVTDRATANAAIDLILKQGEGVDAQPGFSSHFNIYCEIYKEFIGAQFDPAWNVVTNPSHQNVTDEFARKAMDFFNESYTTMMYMLVSFYKFFSPASCDSSHRMISTALQNTAFAPMMTMVVRPLGEIITRLPAGPEGFYAGPNWDIDEEDYALTPHSEPDFFIERLRKMKKHARKLRDSAPSKEVAARLNYMWENLSRVELNFKQMTNS